MASDNGDDPRKQREREILECAKQVFAERGFHKASINDIIQRANIARGTFYLYFRGKQEVFDSILDEALEELRARITRIDVDTPDADPPQVQLRQSLIRVMEYVLGDRPLTLILLNHKQTPDVDVAARVDAFFSDITDMIVSSLTYGISAKLVRPCDTSLVAAALLGAVRGMVEYCVAQPEPPSVDQIVDELILFVLRGVFGT